MWNPSICVEIDRFTIVDRPGQMTSDQVLPNMMLFHAQDEEGVWFNYEDAGAGAIFWEKDLGDQKGWVGQKAPTVKTRELLHFSLIV